MARTPEQEKIYKEEKAIGRKAAKMAENFLLQIIKQKLKIRNEGFPEGPILEDTVVKSTMGEYRFLGLNLQSSRTGFILHYGFVGTREATTVYLNHSRYKKEKTQRQRHDFKLPAQQIFEDFYEKSGAIDYLVAELSKTRTQAIQFNINKLAIKFSNQDGKE